jgi:endoglucanase
MKLIEWIKNTICLGLAFTNCMSSALHFKGQEIDIKGVSWFGYETNFRLMHGLWKHDVKFFIDILKSNEFNAIRLPLSIDLMKHHFYDIVTENADPQLRGKTNQEVFDYLFDICKKNGIMILLDVHTLDVQDISELWYNDRFSEEDVHQALNVLVARYKDYPNFLGIDLKNEPHGRTTWCSGDYNTDFRLATIRFIERLNNNFPGYPFLYFVNGIDWSYNFNNVRGDCIVPISQERIVYSPHIYGPTIKRDLNMNYLRETWDHIFGFLVDDQRNVSVGEWGSFYRTDEDKKFLNTFADYMIEKKIRDNFYWSLNPNSGDTGGLLNDDWDTLVYEKLEVLKRVQPKPTKFNFENKLLRG